MRCNNLTPPKAKKWIWIMGPLAGMLVGSGLMFIWQRASLETAPRIRTPHTLHTVEAAAPLRILPTQSLYLDDFKAPEILAHVWQDTQYIIAARIPQQDVAKNASKPVLARNNVAEQKPLTDILAPWSPVQEAQAAGPAPVSTPASTPVAIKAPAASPKTEAVQGVASYPVGTLGQMTMLRAELEHLKMQVMIEETRSRLNQLRGTTAQAPKLSMASLEFPPIGMPSMGSKAGSNPTMRILSIQSVNGRYTATVGTSTGTRAVKVNDTIGESRVLTITRNSVTLSRGQGRETLSIQE